MNLTSPWRKRGTTCLGAAVLLCACQPGDLSGTVRAYVYRLEAAANEYALGVADVEHLESLRELRGRDIDVRRNAEFNMTLLGADVKRGAPFSLEYTVRDDGVVVPGDMHSFYALSMYRNFDRIAVFMRDHGFVSAARLDVLYFPRIDNVLLGDQRSSLTDNAAFASEAHGFLIVPSFVLSDLPMFLNEGVMAHEYGHAIVQQIMFPDGLDLEGNALAAMNEGVADLFGFVETGDPNFILPTADADRDLSVPRTYTAEDYALLLAPETDALSLDDFDPHKDGSTMAWAIYELWPKGPDGKIAEPERLRMLDVVLATLRSISYGDGFTFGTFPNALVAQLPAADQAAACTVLNSRLAPLAADLTNCAGP